MGTEAHGFTALAGTARAVLHFRLSDSHYSRDILIIDTAEGAVALFGYFSTEERWHFMIVPPEFREPRILEDLRLVLLEQYQAVLRTIPGDTINLTPEQVRSLPLCQARSSRSPRC